MRSFLGAVLFFSLVLTAQADNKVVVIPLGADGGPGDWKTVAVSSLSGVARDSSVATAQRAAACGSNIGRYAVAGSGAEFLVVPIQLPDGATITSFTGVVCDRNAAYSSSMYLYRSDGKLLASTDSGPAYNSATLSVVTAVDVRVAYSVIDNSQYSYFIFMGVDGRADNLIVPISGIVTLK